MLCFTTAWLRAEDGVGGWGWVMAEPNCIQILVQELSTSPAPQEEPSFLSFLRVHECSELLELGLTY